MTAIRPMGGSGVHFENAEKWGTKEPPEQVVKEAGERRGGGCVRSDVETAQELVRLAAVFGAHKARYA